MPAKPLIQAWLITTDECHSAVNIAADPMDQGMVCHALIVYFTTDQISQFKSECRRDWSSTALETYNFESKH